MKSVVIETYPVVVNREGVVPIHENMKCVARLFPEGVVETYQGYDPAKVARGIWATVDPKSDTLVFFPNEHGEGLVTFNRDGRAVYRKDYTPDPVARMLWTCIADLDPWNAYGPPPGQTFKRYREPKVGGTKPIPGFVGVWGTGASIDCYRPR
jgi:hypothetical protein